MGLYRIGVGPEALTIKLVGRQEWTLKRLLAAGVSGCTSVTDPAPRWSCYVHRLRQRGIAIETVRESHGGSWPGAHGRYRLSVPVEPVSAENGIHGSSRRPARGAK